MIQSAALANNLLKRGAKFIQQSKGIIASKVRNKQTIINHLRFAHLVSAFTGCKPFLLSNPMYKFSHAQTPNSSPSNIQVIEREADQLKSSLGQNSMQYVQKLHQLSFAYAQSNNLQKAITLYQQVVRLFKHNIPDKQSPAIGDCLKNLQMLYQRAGKIMEFIPLTLQLLEIRLKQFKTQEHKDIAHLNKQLGVAYYHIQNYQEATTRYQTALKIREKLFAHDSIEVLQLKNNIAMVYFQQQQFDKAKILFEQNIHKLRNSKILNQKALITPLTNLTAILENQGKYEEALKNYNQIIQILNRVDKKESFFLANIYHSMGIVYLKMNDMVNAEQSHSKSLKINESLYTQGHSNIAENYHNLAICYESKGQFDKALDTYTKSVEMKKKLLGPHHPSLAQTYQNMGIVYKFIGKIRESRRKYEECLQILRAQNAQDNTNPLFGDMYTNIGVTYIDEQNAQKAIEYFQKAEKSYKNFYDQSHPKLADLFFNKAKVQFVFIKNFLKSRQFLDKAISSYQKFAPNNPNLYIKYSMKGSCFYEQKRFNQAIQCYTKALQSLSLHGKGLPQQVLANTGLLSYQIGSAYYQLKSYPLAQAQLNKSIEIFQKHFSQAHQTLVELYFMLGNVYKSLEGNHKQKSQTNYKKSLLSMDKILQKFPNQQVLIKKKQQILKQIIN